MASASTRSAARDVRTNAERTADATDELVDSLTDEIRNRLVDAVYAALGTSDLAFGAARELTRRTVALPGDVAKTVTELPGRLVDEFDDLADRGRLISARIQGNEQWQEAIGEVRQARRQASRAAHTGLQAVEQGADAVSDIVRSGAHRAEATARVESSSSSRGGGGGNRYENRTVEELREIAADRQIEGRSSMNKDELIDAIRGA